ncbi:thiamine phosphate synthase [Bacillus sp. FJAT-29790]|uniref:thiamine phosphate synthase n=1 Tax=Bacillus sp. FJAT-29790 TaxID=1895002 RepID=UPI001C2215F5|nr:thiamine phosphate synthase [Bacillus sp. FJAT-29790]MBU8878455.1 thiamine phosphate synthase [Bacillus sp. FJAT-29790]
MNYKLYLVTEESVPIEELLRIIEEAIKGGVTLVQLREKKTTGSSFLKKAKSVKELLTRYDVPLIINDRVDVALAVNAAGVHVGQSDLPLSAVRIIVPDSMIVGISVSTVEEAKEAEENGADYIGVGAAFPTQSKSDAEVLPKGMLETIANAVSIPAVAIGGINLRNIETIRNINLAGVAIVSGIMKAENPFEAAVAFRKAWD